MTALYDITRRDADAQEERDARRGRIEQNARAKALHGAAIDYFTLIDACDVRLYWHTAVLRNGDVWQVVVIRLSCARYVAEAGKPVTFKSKRLAAQWLAAHR